MPDRPLNLLVLGNPIERVFALLERLPPETRITVQQARGFADAAETADAILTWMVPRDLLERVFAMAPHVRWIHSGSVGVENVLFPGLIESPVTLTNARGAYSAALGEFVLAAMLFFAKDLRRMTASQAAGRWDQFDVEMLQGKVLGIVGYGDIGRAVAQRVHGLGVRIVAVRRRRRDFVRGPARRRTYPVEQLGEMLAASDYVVAALPLTPATTGLIGADMLAMMKPSAVLINVGRGPVIDEQAMIAALEANGIRGAALDVFEREPLPEGHAFYRLGNVLLSPHTADHTVGWLEQSMELFLANFERFRKGEPLENIVDKRSGY